MEKQNAAITAELIEKAKKTDSKEELFKLAVANGIELDEETLDGYWKKLTEMRKGEGKIADEELENISGGIKGTRACNGHLIITSGYGCDRFQCMYHDNSECPCAKGWERDCGVIGIKHCGTCKYLTHHTGYMYCAIQ